MAACCCAAVICASETGRTPGIGMRLGLLGSPAIIGPAVVVVAAAVHYVAGHKILWCEEVLEGVVVHKFTYLELFFNSS